MTKEELQARIEKAETKVNKIQKKIDKMISAYSATTEEIAVCKAFENAPYGVKPRDVAYWDFKGSKEYQEVKAKFIDYVNAHKNRENELLELRRAYTELCDAKVTLSKYQVSLDKLTQYESSEKIEVVWNFLQNWKQDAIEFIKEDAKNLVEYDKLESQHCDRANSGYYREHPEQRLIDNREMDDLLRSVHALTRKVYNRRSPTLVYDDLLNEELDKEVRAKYERLIEDVTAITGVITDASHLRISPRGNLDGFVIGEKGKAKVTTISAEGPIQRFHYRCLIHPIREKLNLKEN